jgi:hypothetical protein
MQPVAPSPRLPSAARPASPPAPPLPPIEPLIGEVTAAAAIAILAALQEWQAGSLAAATRTAGGDRITELYALRQAALTTRELPAGFEATARVHGTRVLRQRCGRELTEAAIRALVDAVLEILAKVVRSQAH